MEMEMAEVQVRKNIVIVIYGCGMSLSWKER